MGLVNKIKLNTDLIANLFKNKNKSLKLHKNLKFFNKNMMKNKKLKNFRNKKKKSNCYKKLKIFNFRKWIIFLMNR